MKYRKKPVAIEAMQWTGNNVGEIELFAPDMTYTATDGYLLVKTLEGILAAKAGDWIIRGVKGEYYPCDNEIFKQTYEAAEEKGFLLQLPCKAGAFVYTTEYEDEKEFVEKKKIDSFEVDENEVTVWLMSIEGKHEVVYLEDFGQCVFLTREEAETALRGWKNEAD